MPERRDQEEPTLSPEASDRAAGLLLGAAVADGWSTSTEIALCVADAAATGLPLTDREVLGLLGRNLRLRRQERGAADATETTDGLLSGTAVVALAHLHDSPRRRARATRAVAALLDTDASVPLEHLVSWVEVVAATIRTGAVPDLDESSAVRSILQVAAVAEHATGSNVDRFSAGLAAIETCPAAAGALLGALLGRRAVAPERTEQLSGWPDAGPTALVGLGILAVRPKSGTVAGRHEDVGVTIPLREWPPVDAAREAESPSHEARATSGGGWKRSHVVVTTADAEVSNV